MLVIAGDKDKGQGALFRPDKQQVMSKVNSSKRPKAKGAGEAIIDRSAFEHFQQCWSVINAINLSVDIKLEDGRRLDSAAYAARWLSKMPRLKDKYHKEVVPRLMELSQFKNIMQVPRIEKIVLNIGMGEAISNGKAMEAAQGDLTAIAGQHPVITRSRKSIANFKLRVDMPIGLKVTLRGERSAFDAG
jgi:hypothetical protein